MTSRARTTLITIAAAATMLTVTTLGAIQGELRGIARAAGRVQADAVIWLEAPAAVATRRPMPVMDQHDLQFLPHVLVVQTGTTVKFPNDDRVFHNVFSFHDGKKFDLGVYPIGAVKYVTFERAGVSRLFCNIHPNMAAYVVAVDSPYFAATDAAGAFTITAPPGRYTYHAWRAGSPVRDGSIEIDAATTMDIAWP